MSKDDLKETGIESFINGLHSLEDAKEYFGNYSHYASLSAMQYEWFKEIYQTKLKTGLPHFEDAYDKGIEEASYYIQLLQEKLGMEPIVREEKGEKKKKRKRILLPIALSVLFLAGLIHVLAAGKGTGKAEEMKPYTIKVIEVPIDLSNDEIEQIIQEEAKNTDPNSPFLHQFHIVKREKASVIPVKVATFSPKFNSIKLEQPRKELYPSTDSPSWLNATILRSALYQFVVKEGRFPDRLEELTTSYPNNYLSNIPLDSEGGKNVVYSEHNGLGGWVYKKPAAWSKDQLLTDVKNAVFPNTEEPLDGNFYPLELRISKNNHTIKLYSGPYLIKTYPVGLGKDNLTPEGEFYIQKRVVQPRSSDETSSFGTRGLELSDPHYAIHGTSTTTSIGKNESHGCVRLKNDDVEELYAMTPLFTPVHIAQTEVKSYLTKAEMTPSKSIGSGRGNSYEQTKETFRWAN